MCCYSNRGKCIVESNKYLDHVVDATMVEAYALGKGIVLA